MGQVYVKLWNIYICQLKSSIPTPFPSVVPDNHDERDDGDGDDDDDLINEDYKENVCMLSVRVEMVLK